MFQAQKHHTMMQFSKIGLLSLSIILMILVFVWPYITPQVEQYHIQELPTDEVVSESVVVTPTPQAARIPATHLKDGSMLFQGKTQIIICPEDEKK